MTDDPVYFYRYIDPPWNSEDGELAWAKHTANPEIGLVKFGVLRSTAKGVWLDLEWGNKKFVLLGSGRRFAYPTKEAAQESYMRRKASQIRHANDTLTKAMQFLRSAQKGLWADG